MNNYTIFAGHCFIAAAIVFHGLMGRESYLSTLREIGIISMLLMFFLGVFIFFFRSDKK